MTKRFLNRVRDYSYKPHPALLDNKGAIDLRKNAHFSSITKRINVRHHFIKQSIEDNLITINFMPSIEMLADALTKGTRHNNAQQDRS